MIWPTMAGFRGQSLVTARYGGLDGSNIAYCLSYSATEPSLNLVFPPS